MRTFPKRSSCLFELSDTPSTPSDHSNLKGLDNGRLYREIAGRYDLFFTKDRDFASQVRLLATPLPVKAVLTTIPQQPAIRFVTAFMQAFAQTDWAVMAQVGEWPTG